MAGVVNPLPAIDVTVDRRAATTRRRLELGAHPGVRGRRPRRDAAAEPAGVISRLLCPRRLDPETTYTAFVVPTFEIGRQAGLGPGRLRAAHLRPGLDAEHRRAAAAAGVLPVAVPHQRSGRLRVAGAPAGAPQARRGHRRAADGGRRPDARRPQRRRPARCCRARCRASSPRPASGTTRPRRPSRPRWPGLVNRVQPLVDDPDGSGPAGGAADVRALAGRRRCVLTGRRPGGSTSSASTRATAPPAAWAPRWCRPARPRCSPRPGSRSPGIEAANAALRRPSWPAPRMTMLHAQLCAATSTDRAHPDRAAARQAAGQPDHGARGRSTRAGSRCG